MRGMIYKSPLEKAGFYYYFINNVAFYRNIFSIITLYYKRKVWINFLKLYCHPK